MRKIFALCLSLAVFSGCLGMHSPVNSPIPERVHSRVVPMQQVTAQPYTSTYPQYILNYSLMAIGGVGFLIGVLKNNEVYSIGGLASLLLGSLDIAGHVLNNHRNN